MNEQNQRELERLRKIFPLFEFELENEHLTVKMSRGSSYNTTMINGRIDHASSQYIEHDHMSKTMGHELMKQYPDLYISVYGSKDGCSISVWINRPNEKEEDDDAESIGKINLVSKNLHATLDAWQEEARKAKQKNWFFCSGHQKAEPISEYGYFYFAGKFCKTFGEANPKHRTSAARETYN